MNILVTLNSGYVRQLIVMLYSLLSAHEDTSFKLYILYNSLTKEDFEAIGKVSKSRLEVFPIAVPKDFLKNAPTSNRYPTEMYYRIFAARLLPQNVDRTLYLDPDLVVINPLDELYNMSLGKKLFAAASHTGAESMLGVINEVRLSMPKGSPYFNSGVMLMNIAALRQNQDENEVFEYIKKHQLTLMLPDQDVLNAVYSNEIVTVDYLRYNLSERCFGLYNMAHPTNPLTLKWVEQNTAIIHYCGRNKPWKKNYFGEFDCFYKAFEQAAIQEDLIC